jgi:septum formation protein
MLNEILNEPLVLASRSPRRTEILQAIGWPFESAAAGIDETRRTGEDALQYVQRLALMKAQVVAERLSGRLVLGADTVVLVDAEILGQPVDASDARRMLQQLSGKWHEVLTGVALVRVGESACTLMDHEITRVLFADLSAEEIDWYIETGEPMDKAGAYAIQGKAAPFIEKIEGDYFNVVGLPIRLLYKLRKRMKGNLGFRI